MNAVHEPPRAGAIALNDVAIHFGENRTAVQAVSGIDLQIQPGEFISVLGPSGCGKSTLIGAIAAPQARGARAALVGVCAGIGGLRPWSMDGRNLLWDFASDALATDDASPAVLSEWWPSEAEGPAGDGRVVPDRAPAQGGGAVVC